MTSPQGAATSGSGPGPSVDPSSTRASLAGVGGGTGIVAIAQAMGADTATGAILLYLSPSLSFVIGLFLYFVDVQASRYLERRVVSKAQQTLEEQLANDKTSETHKARIREMLEELQETVASAELARVKGIGGPPRAGG